MQNDFGKGKMWKVIMAQALPMMAAQFVHLLYNVVDRIYIGHLENIGAMALTGIGLAFPITTLVAAFTNLFATGGAPLFAVSRGQGNDKKAEFVLSQVTGLLSLTSVILLVLSLLFKKQILYLFGASDASYAYADAYLKVYIWGTSAAMLSTGLNGFINASGYPRVGMMTVFLGAALNLVLDPLLIYTLHMGVSGAALATVISQLASCFWAVSFFLRESSPYRIRLSQMKPTFGVLKEIIPLGTAGFIMQGTNSLVSIICNTTLRMFGGDLYVGVMTVINSVREILMLPGLSISQGAQPVLSYNYGAKDYTRLKSGIRFMTACVFVYTSAAWILTLVFPAALMSVFTDDAQMIASGTDSLRLYFFAFPLMAFQNGGQSTFTALRCPKRAIFFSLFRKVIMVVPLTILLPRMGLGVSGVFAAEPVSNVVGGIACFAAMYLSVYRKLPKDGEEALI